MNIIQLLHNILSLPYLVLLLALLTLPACLTIQSDADLEMMMEDGASDMKLPSSPIEVNEIVLQSSLLMRVLPANTMGEAQIFCEAVAVQSNLLLTSAHCFRQGINFAEVFTGQEIDISNPNTVAIPVKSYYIHEGFNETDPSSFQNNIALVELVGSSNSSILTPLSNIEQANLESFIRVGYEKLDLKTFKRFVQVMIPITVQMNEIIFGDTNSNLCEIGGGATVANYNNETKLVALNHRSDIMPCGSAGAALRVDIHQNWVSTSIQQLAMNEIGNRLLCAQALLCYDRADCNRALKMEHRTLYTNLFLCGEDADCETVQCYANLCEEEYLACVNAQ